MTFIIIINKDGKLQEKNVKKIVCSYKKIDFLWIANYKQ